MEKFLVNDGDVVYKICFLLPKNKNCGVHNYSEHLFEKISIVTPKGIKLNKVYFKNCNNPLYYFKLARKISKVSDVIHLQHEFGLFGRFGIGFLFFMIGLRKKVIITFHELHTGKVGLKEKLLIFPFSWKIRKVIVLSEYAAKRAKRFFPTNKIIMTGFGVTKKRSLQRTEKGLVVHLGLVRYNKNQLFTVKLAMENPKLNFVIAGGGDNEYYKEIVLKSKNIPNLKVTGFLSTKEYFRLIARAEFVILPYLSVVQSAVFFDTIACGKKILASDLEPFKEYEAHGVIKTSPILLDKFSQKLNSWKGPAQVKIIDTYLDQNNLLEVAKRNVIEYNTVLSE